MFRLPQNGQWKQPNSSDVIGSAWYTKSIDFDEQGYARLSQRSVSLGSELTDSNVDLPIAFGRKTGGEYLIASADEPLILNFSETSVSLVQDTDTGNPDGTFNTGGAWFQDRWHVTTASAMRYKSGSTWTDTGVSLTTGVPHPVEVFRNRNTICVGNGNVVKQYTTAYAASTDLTIPSGFEVLGLDHSGNRMGVITRISSTVSGQNQEAYFFIWDGASTSAGVGYPVGSDAIYAIAAYRGSWVLLARTGELLFWNGGGFQTLAALPFHYQRNLHWGSSFDRQIYGNALLVDGERIYVNVNAEMSPFGRNEEYVQDCPTGVLCYDPKVGLYHRYSPSVSVASLLNVPQANVSTSTDRLTASAGTIPATGNPVKYVSSAATQIGGLTIGTVYYVIRHSSTVFQLATSKANAEAGTAVDLTSTGAANNYFLAIDVVDYGASRANRTGALADVGISNFVADHLVFGGEYYDVSSSSEYGTVCATVEGFENRGVIRTPWLRSSNVEDVHQGVTVKHGPLGTLDSIVVKAKTEKVRGLPVTTPQGSRTCTWTSSTVFTTTADISAAKTYLDAGGSLEVEITSGAGAGTFVQVASITESSGTYTVTVDEAVVGAASGRYSDVVIDNWLELDTFTSATDKGWFHCALTRQGKEVKYSLELRGVGTTVEEVQALTAPNIMTQ